MSNKFGLVDGSIPAGMSCPFGAKCAFLDNKCPTPDHLLRSKFNCFAARAWALVDGGNDSLALRSLITNPNIRRVRPLREDEKEGIE